MGATGALTMDVRTTGALTMDVHTTGVRTVKTLTAGVLKGGSSMYNRCTGEEFSSGERSRCTRTPQNCL